MTEIPIRYHLDRHVRWLLDAATTGNPIVPLLLEFARVGSGELTEDVARHVVALDHWYPDWATAAADTGTVDLDFEQAADAVHTGDLAVLGRLLDARPSLVTARSPFPHHATLLQYVAANGVEVERQYTTPHNAVAVMHLLLAAGADPNATCDTYGGGINQTTLTLLVTSAHPAIAGLQGALVEELCRGGAAVNGLGDDGVPLWRAIISGYRDAVDGLHRAGARIDNAVCAAAVGDLGALDRYLELPAAIVAPASETQLPAEHLLEYALIYATGLDRVEVVEHLLRRDPDLEVREPYWNATARAMAAHRGNRKLTSLLGG